MTYTGRRSHKICVFERTAIHKLNFLKWLCGEIRAVCSVSILHAGTSKMATTLLRNWNKLKEEKSSASLKS